MHRDLSISCYLRVVTMTLPANKACHVRAVHCDYRSSEEDVYQALKRATDPLDQAWEKLSRARRIGIKFNQDWVAERVVYHEGHRQQLVSDPVTRAVLRLLQERTRAEIYAIDVGVEGIWAGVTDGSSTSILPILNEMGVPMIYGEKEATDWVNVPGGGW